MADAKANQKVEEVYSAKEFANAPDMFGDGVRSYAVLAAFQYAGVEKATKAEAKKIVDAFRNKKVGE